jgi:hypothetical protein
LCIYNPYFVDIIVKRMATWAYNLMQFYTRLQPPAGSLPNDIEWLHPQQHAEVQKVLKQFLYTCYNDSQPRRLLLGINPGRFGSGITGINFTAPKQLTENCHIEHTFKTAPNFRQNLFIV